MKIKRLVVAGVVASTLAGGAFAFANSLTVTSNTLASGSGGVDSGCASVSTSWTTAYDSGRDAYELATVTVGGDVTACGGKYVKIAVNAGADSAEFNNSGNGYQLSAGTGKATVTVSGSNIDAALVDSVTAVVNGAQG